MCSTNEEMCDGGVKDKELWREKVTNNHDWKQFRE